jgi:pimeloyl-ACP methyl ester carboxylesterase
MVANVLISPGYLAAHPEWLPGWVKTVAGYDLSSFPNLGRAIAERDDMTSFTPTLNVPVVVFHGPDDSAVPFAEGQAMAARIPGARLVAVPGVGHAPPLERPELVCDVLARFVVDMAGSR